MQNIHKTVLTKSRKFCSVPQCSSYCTSNISLHQFPLGDEKLCLKWKTVLKIEKCITKNMHVCSLHFQEQDYCLRATPLTIRRKLKKGVVPSQKIPSEYPKTHSKDNRSKTKWLKRKLPMEEESGNIPGEGQIETENNVESENGKNTYFTTSDDVFPSCSSEKEHITQLQVVQSLEHSFYYNKSTQASGIFQLSDILDTDEKLGNFTGINYNILSVFWKCAASVASHNSYSDEKLRNEILLVLCKLKTNMSFARLSILFNISHTSAASIFNTTVSLLAVAVKPVIYWPTKEEILKNMPKCFNNFRNTRVVLDCIEIKVKGLKSLKNYSHYNETDTMKFIIGITPSGLISCVSSVYGGRATDKSIFNREGLIKKVDANDAIMVDKEVLIEKECEEHFIKLIRPPFLKSQKQLSKNDATLIADIARARVHVDKAIQKMKIFKILHEQIDWYLIPYIDDIVTIIAASVNMSRPILSDGSFDYLLL